MKRSASGDLAGAANQRRPFGTQTLAREHADCADTGIAALDAFEAAAGLQPAHDRPGAAAAAGVLMDLDSQQSSAPTAPAAAVVPTHSSLSDADAAARILSATGEQQTAADPGALQQQPSEPSQVRQDDSQGLAPSPDTVVAPAALEATKGSMAAAQPVAQQQNTQAAAGGMPVTDLKAVLARVYPDKEAVRAHMVPVRYLAKLLQGEDVDHSTVQLATLLPHVDVLMSHMRDRVAGAVQGKQVMAPHKAAAHAAALQHVLGCAEVQAELGQQQVLQLLATVRAAEQEFEASGRQVTSHEQAAPASTQEEGHAADGTAAAGVEDMGVGSIAQQGAAHSLSVAQLLVEARTLHRNIATALRKLLVVVHGPEADAAAVQVADLLPQWPLLQAHLQQRVKGEGQEPPLKPRSAFNYAQGIFHCLALPSVQAQFSAASLAQLVQQVQDGKVQLSSTPDGTARATGLATTNTTAAAAAAAAAAPGADTAATAANRPRRGAAAGGMSVTQLLDALARSYNGQTVSSAQTAINKLLLLVHGPGADAAAVWAAGLLQQWPVLCADLQQRMTGPKPSMKPSTAHAVYASSILRVLRMPQVQAQFDSKVLQRLQRQVKADRVAYFPWSGQGKALGGIAGRKGACDSESDGEGSDAAVSSECGSEGVIESEAAGADDETSPPAAVGVTQQQVMTLGELKEQLASNYSARSMLNGVAKAAGFDEFSREAQPLPAVLQAQHVQGFLGALRERGCSRKHQMDVARQLTAVVSRRLVQRSLAPDSLQQLQQAFEQRAAAGRKGKPAVLQSAGHIDVEEGDERSPSQLHGQTAGPGQGEQPAVTSALDAATADSNAAGQRGAAFATAQLAAAAAQAQPSAKPTESAPPLADASVRNLLAAQGQVLALYAHKLSPSLSEKLALRSTLQMLAGLPPGDIRLDMFWTDYDWVVMLSEEAESTPEHWREAFDTLIANATSGT